MVLVQQELVVPGAKTKALLGLLSCSALMGATIPLFMMAGPHPELTNSDPIMAKVLIAFLLPIAAFFGAKLALPKSCFLRLTPEGFEKCGLVKRESYKWKEVSNVRVVHQQYNAARAADIALLATIGSWCGLGKNLPMMFQQQMVAFDFRGQRFRVESMNHCEKLRQKTEDRFEGDSQFMYVLEGYKIKPEELVALMTEWKERAEL